MKKYFNKVYSVAVLLCVIGSCFAGTKAVLQSPLNESYMHPVDDTPLVWTAPADYQPDSYDVYLHSSKAAVENGLATALVSAAQTGTEYWPPGKLYVNTGYYWRIDSYKDGQKYTGDVWYFRTAASSGVSGDITNGGAVCFQDIAKMARSWCEEYDFIDFAKTAQNWRAGYFPKQLNVMTYNIHHGEGTDGVLSLERIAQVIEQANASIVGLQEVDNGRARTNYVNQAQWLAQRLGMYYYFAPAAYSNTYGNAVLSRYPFVLLKNYPLPQYASEETRACALAVINIDGRLFTIFDSHFDFTNNTVAEMQAAEVVRISNLVVGDKIFVGDLNTYPHESPITILGQTYIDTFAILDNTASHIDYVFVSRNFRGEVSFSAFVKNSLTQVASDHYPVVAGLVCYTH